MAGEEGTTENGKDYIEQNDKESMWSQWWKLKIKGNNGKTQALLEEMSKMRNEHKLGGEWMTNNSKEVSKKSENG